MKVATVLKTVTLCLYLLLFCAENQGMAQDAPEIAKVKSSKLTEILNNVEFVERGRSSKYIIRLFKIHNGYGSAAASGEVSYRLMVAVSQISTEPEQSLFEMGPLLNPVFGTWEKSDGAGVFTLEHGPYDNRKQIKLSADLWQLKKIDP